MSNTIEQLKQYAWLSQASYLDLTGVASFGDPTGKLKDSSSINPDKIFADKQATQLDTDFNFICQQPNDSYGFSATLFQSKSDPNRYIIAVRGTETGNFIPDLLSADAFGVVLTGKAAGQAISAYRWYKELVSTAAPSTVIYTDAEISMLRQLYIQTSAAAAALGILVLGGIPVDTATTMVQNEFETSLRQDQAFSGPGKINNPGAVIDFTGHSLGGHVATLLGDMVATQNSGTVGNIVTYNAPGQNGIPAMMSNLAGIDTSRWAPNTTNIIGEGGLSVTAGLGSVQGNKQNIFIEQEFTPWGSEGGATPNHSIVKLSDSLALYALFNKINGSFSNDDINAIIKASSATSLSSLEKNLSALYKLFTGSATDIAAGDRTTYYNKAAELGVAIASNSQALNIVSLVSADVSTLKANALNPNNLAIRYALKELNPFVIFGANYAQFFNSTGQLNLYDPATGTGEMTNEYIADRSAMLTWAIHANTDDTTTLDGAKYGYNDYHNWQFRDEVKDLTLHVKGTTLGLTSTTPENQVIFGSDGADSLTGGDQADRLYGGLGDDILTGNAGADYMEGNGGNDSLSGGFGNDIINGGTGDDTLIGGAGSDTLSGGIGNDTYIFTSGDNWDWIDDSGGLGQIIYDNTPLNGGAKITDNVWRSADNRFTYSLYDRTENGTTSKVLSILGPDGGMWVKHWQQGTLGIQLPDASTDTGQTATQTATGDSDQLHTTAANQTLDGLGGNDMLTGGYTNNSVLGNDGNDIVMGGDGAQTLDGGAGSDFLQGGNSNDILTGGTGDDVLDGGAGSDVLNGGDGNDVLYASGGLGVTTRFSDLSNPNFAGFVTSSNGQSTLSGDIVGYQIIEDRSDDILNGGDGNDILIGGEGDDLADGGNDNDAMVGASGNDYLMGSEGNDTLYGDGTHGSTIVWTSASGDVDISIQPQFHGNDTLDGGDGNDYLQGDGGSDELYGGAGDDSLVGDAHGLDGQYQGNDYLDGEDGNDTLSGDGGDDTLFGGTGDDWIQGDNANTPLVNLGNDYLDGEDGNDMLIGGGGADTLFGGAGNDTLAGDSDNTPLANQGSDYLDGEDGDDYLRGYAGDDTLLGGSGNDTLFGEVGNDILSGEDGNDQLQGGAGADSLDGGDGSDFLWGGDGNDSLLGGSGDDTLSGEAGDDVLSGGDGNDLLDGGDGNNTLMGDAGNDILQGGSSNDLLDGGSGDDTVIGQAGDDNLSGGDDNDLLDGGSGNDVLAGGDGNDQLQGADGNDYLTGDGGNDAIYGQAGDDTLDGGSGADTLIGGDGNDTYVINAGDGVKFIYDNDLNNTIVFGEGIDASQIVLRLGSLALDLGNGDVIHIENIVPGNVGATSSIQHFRFADGSERSIDQLLERGFDLVGTDNADYIDGTNLTDRIDAGAGNDTLVSGDGDDVLTGGSGNDLLNGGMGSDTYAYNAGDGNDRILDQGGLYIDMATHSYKNAGSNTLRFEGVNLEDVGASLVNGRIVLNLADGGSIDIGTPDDNTIQTLSFSNGTTLTTGEFIARTPLDITGTPAPEKLYGTDYADRIDGLAGDDTISGQGGDDTYVYNLGDGNDQIYDSGHNSLSFGAGITADMVTPRFINGQLVLEISPAADGGSLSIGSWPDYEIHGFYDINPFDSLGIKTLGFADGATLSIQDFVMQRGLTYTGTDAGDTLYGEDARNGWVPDRLEGGRGNDTLIGGGGNDIYVFNRGDGADAIIDGAGLQYHPTWEWTPGGDNTLVFGPGISPDEITVSYRQNRSVVLDMGNGDSVDIGSDYDLAVQALQFANGTTIDTHSFLLQHGAVQTGTSGADSLGGFLDVPKRMEGLAGDDSLAGSNHDDILIGGTGNDSLSGEGGQDTYMFQRGDGADWIFFDHYQDNNILSLGAGISLADITSSWDESAGQLVLDFGQGDRIMLGSLLDPAIATIRFADGSSIDLPSLLAQNGVVQFAGTDGNDLLANFASGQPLLGLGGDDRLYGSTLDDTLEGGAGIDTLIGGMGSDTYQYNLGDDDDSIVDNGYGTQGELHTNTLSFGAGIDASMIAPIFDPLERTLALQINNDGIISLGPVNNLAIQDLQFADGTHLSLNDFIKQTGGLPQTGREYGDSMDGTPFADRLLGLDGNDNIYGGDGNDTLEGGRGFDWLDGSYGNDTYVFNRGDGEDWITDSAYSNAGQDEVNTLVFSGGITRNFITLGLGTGDFEGQICLTVTNEQGEPTGDQVNIKIGNRNDLSDLAIQQVVFSDGMIVSMESLLFNKPPQANLSVPLGDQVTRQDANFAYTLPADAFTDPDDNALNYTVRIKNGDPLPAWLSFDPASETLSGTPSNADVTYATPLDLTVTATDSGGLSVSRDFTLDVLNVNDAPTVVTLLSNQTAVEGETFSFTLPGWNSGGGFMNDPTDQGTPDPVDIHYDSSFSGGLGNDTYNFGRGDGNVYVSDWDETPGNVDTVQFGAGLTPADITVHMEPWDKVVLSINGTGDSLTLGSWLYTDSTLPNPDASKIERLAFADGTVWDVADIMARISTSASTGNDYIVGSNADGTIRGLAGNDEILGGNGDELLLGGAGYDKLVGGGGSDILVGGSGSDEIDANWLNNDTSNDVLDGGSGDEYLYASLTNDLLIGGQGNDYLYSNNGNDVLLFNRGDGLDEVDPGTDNDASIADISDTLSLGGGIAYADLSFSRVGSNLILNTGNGEGLTFDSWFATWADYKTIKTLQIVADGMPGYSASSTNPLLNKRIYQFDFVALANQFALALKANPTLGDWSLAPHLSTCLQGSSDSAAIGGDMAYAYGKDGNLDRLSETALRGQLNDAQFGIAAQAISLDNSPATFNDIDAIYGDTLTYSATRENGSALPAWLNFDPATGRFSGTPGNGDIGNLVVAVTATDSGGLSAKNEFTLHVTSNGVNAAPVAANPLADQVTLQDASFSFTVPADAFVDPDGDTLKFAASMTNGDPLPGWLSFDAASGTFSGTPGNAAVTLVAPLDLTVTATDPDGLSASRDFTLDVLNVNDLPIATGEHAVIDEDTVLSTTQSALLANDGDIDPTHDVLQISAVGNAAHGQVTMDASNVVFTPDANYNGPAGFDYTVSDGQGGSADASVVIDVLPINDAPVAAPDSASAQEDTLLEASGNVLSNDSDVDAGTLLQVGDAGVHQGTFGTLTLQNNGSYRYVLDNASSAVQSLRGGAEVTETFSYSANDGMAGVSSTLTVTITGTNDAPVALMPLTNQTANESAPFAFTMPADTFGDVDTGDVLTYSARMGDGNALPTWLSFNATTGSFTGTPAQGNVGDLTISVTATDSGGLSASEEFTLHIASVNHAPVAANPIAAQVTHQGDAFSFVVPANAFTDPDGDTLKYAASQSDGSPLPAWLHFDAASGTFSGTPGNADVTFVAPLNLTVTATDPDGLSTSRDFTLDVLNVNDAPVTTGEHVVIDEDTVLSYTQSALLANDGDIDPTRDVLRISTVGNATHGQVTMDAGNVVFTPDANYNGSAGFDYTVIDGQGGSANASVVIDVLPVNDAPVALLPLSDQTTSENTLFAFTMPSGTFGDVDIGDVLAYGATLANGNALPAWLSFDPATGKFSGTPAHANIGNLSIKVTATDLAGATASEHFALAIEGSGNAPPITVQDKASVTEDSRLTAQGNVLANDSDPDAGTVLHVADSGVRQGTYGKLTLSSDGSYRYVLANASNAVQSLGIGQSAIDRFTYQASDGTASATGELFVTVSGKNDIPILVIPLQDRKLTANTDVIWQVPANSFTDVDRGDVLSYRASLANGAALPKWLVFDTVTRTFRGHVPKDATGVLNVRVTASDGHGTQSVASDIFSIVLSKGNSHGDHGNEGVGNGQDDPPSGHDTNWNDGAGTSPGNPGSSGGNDNGNGLHVITDANCNQIWLKHTGNDLELSVIGTTEKLTMTNWYSSSSHLDLFETADNKVLSSTQVEKLVQAMASFDPPPSGQMVLPHNYQEALAPVIAANWH